MQLSIIFAIAVSPLAIASTLRGNAGTEVVIDDIENIQDYISALAVGGGPAHPFLTILEGVSGSLVQPNGKTATTRLTSKNIEIATDHVSPGGYEGFHSGAFSNCLENSNGRANPVIRDAKEVGPTADGKLNTIHEAEFELSNGSEREQKMTHSFTRTITTSATAQVTKSLSLGATLPIPIIGDLILSLSTETQDSQTASIEENVAENIEVTVDAKTCVVGNIKITGTERIQKYKFPTYLHGIIVEGIYPTMSPPMGFTPSNYNGDPHICF